MNEFIQYHRILLIRARPGSDRSRLGQDYAARLIDQGGRLLVFFHAEGVEHAAEGEPSAEWRSLADWHGVVLAICSGSWSRRHREQPAPPFVISSLTGFWNHAVDAREVICFGAGDGDG